ncbi:unnamed protein product [Ectocarpus sp. CCAP 1310/34]|nr:unnamed protein product [Ectocarpus sp. CCAP 1310/34]
MSASEVGGAGPEAAAVPAGDDGSETPQQQQTEEQLSALRENLARKGKNSYYYAHDRVMDTPSWDGRSAPRRLATTSATKPAPKKAEKVTDYAWANEKAKVKIYVPLEGCADIEDDSISLKWEASCLDLEVTLPSGVARRLHIPSLHDDITGATFRKKKSKMIVTLVKKDEVTWYDLTSTNSR